LAYEGVVSIFEKAIDRALKKWTEDEKERVLGMVRSVIKQLSEGKITSEDAFYELVGIAYEYLVPITPRDEAELKKLLGLK
jgi:hypothetical protein